MTTKTPDSKPNMTSPSVNPNDITKKTTQPNNNTKNNPPLRESGLHKLNKAQLSPDFLTKSEQEYDDYSKGIRSDKRKLSQAQPPQFEVRRDVRSKHLSQERPQKDSRSQSKHRSQEKENETETKEENMPPDKEHSTSKPTKRNSQEKNSSSSTSKTTSTSPRAGDRKKETPSVEPKVTHDKHLKITLSPATRPRKYSAPPKSNEKLHKDIKSNEPKENSPLVSTSTSTSTTTPTPSTTTPTPSTTTTTTTSSVTTSGTTHTNSPSIPARERIDKDNKEKELHHHKDYKKKVIETSSVKRNSLDITRTSKDQTVTSSSGGRKDKDDEDYWRKALGDYGKEMSTLFETFALIAVTFFTPYSKSKVLSSLKKGKRLETIQESDEKEDDPNELLRQMKAFKAFWAAGPDPKQKDLIDPNNLSYSDSIRPAPREKIPLIKTLMSFVPRIVVRRFVTEPTRPIRAPEVNCFYASILFVDISGFSSLAENLAKMGTEGVEKVTVLLNTYFGGLIKLIHDYGGDIVKFAGDALMAIWPHSSQQQLPYLSLLACQCVLEIQKRMGNYDTGISGFKLRLHAGIGAGKVAGIHVGGAQGRLEFFIAGDPIDQLISCEAQAKAGEVFISPEVYRVIKRHFKGEGPFPSKNYRLDGIINPVPLPEPTEFPMLEILEQRLKAYVPPAVLTHLDGVRNVTAEYLAELRIVSVIFCNLDVKYEGDDSPKKLQIAFAGMQAILNRFEGTVRQFILDDKGSVLIAAFGLPPLAHEDDAVRAVEASMELKKVLENLDLKPSIGITTGRTFCGAVGSESRREYAMVGDIVNLSARLMGKAKTLEGILTDEATYIAANKHFEFKALDPIQVKGKGTPIPVFVPIQVVDTKHTMGSTGNAGKNATQRAVIGRDKLLGLIDHKIRMLKQKNGVGNVLVLEGEAGMGKTRLAQEIASFLDDDAVLLFGHSESTANQQYGAWVEIFDAVLDLGAVEDPSQLHSHIRKKLRSIPPTLPLPDLVPSWTKLAPLLKAVFPLEIEHNELTSKMTDQARSENLQILLIRILQTFVPQGSAIVLDDAQYFDTASWTLTLAVSQQLRGVLVVVCLRPLKPPFPFEYQQITHCENAHTMTLTPLSGDDALTLAKQILGVEKIPPQIANQIVEKGQGNPYMIEELTTSLRDSGIITIENGECKVKPGKELILPGTIRQLITSKVDRLSGRQRDILKLRTPTVVVSNCLTSNTFMTTTIGTTTSTTVEFPNSQDWVKEKWCCGNGFVIEGEVTHRRVHTVILKDKSSSSTDTLPTKLIAFRVNIVSGDAIERQFDSQGNEKAIKFHPGSATPKGWLPHFNREKSYGEHVVSVDTVVKALHNCIHRLQIPYIKGLQEAIHPKVPNTLEFWLDSIKFQGIDLVPGRYVRFKTLGNSCFVESIAILDDKLSKYNTFSGNNVKTNWTEKIVAKSDEDIKPSKPVVDVSRDESEWD